MGRINTHHETNEELEGASLPLGHEDSSIPKNECDDEENERLRERVECIAPDGSAVRPSERFLQALAVQSKTVIFPSKGSDGTDRSSSFTGQLSRVFMGLFVGLILEHDNSLHEVVSSLHARDITQLTRRT
jgi:hypothetical protein